MAATRTAKNPTSRNDTPDTPGVSESKIARMKADELRRELKKRGVRGTEELKKPELVKKMIKAELEAGRSSAKSTSKSSAKSVSKSGARSASAAKKSVSAKVSPASTKSSAASTKSSKNPTSRNDTPDTPEVSESKIARMKADEIRRELKNRGVKGTADLKKPELVKKLIKLEVSGSRSGKKGSSGTASQSASGGSASRSGGSASRNTAKSGSGKAVSSSRKTEGGSRKTVKSGSGSAYSQEITSTDERPERYGRSLVTTDHAVIQQWAKARNARPATVAGTDHDGHLGVLRLDFPGYTGDRLVEVSWDDWFDAFDKRGLNFIFQQRLSNGRRSNFFQLENPEE